MKFFSKKLVQSESSLKKLRDEFISLNQNISLENKKLKSKEEKLKLQLKNIDELTENLNTIYKKKEQKYLDYVDSANQGLLKEKEKIKNDRKNLEAVYENVFTSVEWLKDKYSDFYFLLDEKSVVYPKGRSATKCSEAQKEFARENKALRRKVLDLEQQLYQIKSLIPDVEEIIDISTEDKYMEDIEIDISDKIDYLVKYEEQRELSKEEILQRALDRYVKRKLSKSAVGKDYERYIGYLYEQKGYKVQYHGIKKGLADLGIDLICSKGKETLLIQCKNWSKSKNIHENAINQLFGTSMKYYLDKWEVNKYKSKGSLFEDIGIPFNEDFKPVFITTTELSSTALEFAEALRIEVLTIPYEKNYPRIKCNIGKDLNGLTSKIYHLPFDQKYDITQNILNGGENVLTIGEAEEKGYRKAFRWRGE